MFRQHTSLVGRETEFDSRADLRGNVRADSLARRPLAFNRGIGPPFPGQFILSNGLLVQRDDAGIASRRSGFDSPAVHSAGSVIEGPWSKGMTSPWRGGDPGSTPGGSTRTEGSRIRFAEPSC